MNGLDIIFGKYTFETYLLKNTDFSKYFIFSIFYLSFSFQEHVRSFERRAHIPQASPKLLILLLPLP